MTIILGISITTQIIKPIPEMSDQMEALTIPEHHSNILMSVGDFHTVRTQRPQKVILPSDLEMIQVNRRENQPQTTQSSPATQQSEKSCPTTTQPLSLLVIAPPSGLMASTNQPKLQKPAETRSFLFTTDWPTCTIFGIICSYDKYKWVSISCPWSTSRY